MFRVEAQGAVDDINHRIMQALIMQGVHWNQSPKWGLNFQVGSMGDRLSGGSTAESRSRARHSSKVPPILILDEATAALDNKSQGRVQNHPDQQLERENPRFWLSFTGWTCFRIMSKVVVLKAGRIVEQGSYDELLANKGALYTLIHGKEE